MISIELISRGEESLENTLISIKNQDFPDYEIICADSSGKDDVSLLLERYGSKVINLPKNTGFLEARYTAHIHSSGEFSLILDSTRPLASNALSILHEKYEKYDMVMIRENSLGNGFWVEQARLLKIISENQFYRSYNEALAFLLPRFYKSTLLTKAFDRLRSNIGPLFNDIGYGEHHLIFDECMKVSNNMVLTNEILISHYEDDSLYKIVNKYYRYGSSQKILKKLKNNSPGKLSTHYRKGIGSKNRIKIIPITFARGIPFAIGFFL